MKLHHAIFGAVCWFVGVIDAVTFTRGKLDLPHLAISLVLSFSLVLLAWGSCSAIEWGQEQEKPMIRRKHE